MLPRKSSCGCSSGAHLLRAGLRAGCAPTLQTPAASYPTYGRLFLLPTRKIPPSLTFKTHGAFLPELPPPPTFLLLRPPPAPRPARLRTAPPRAPTAPYSSFSSSPPLQTPPRRPSLQVCAYGRAAGRRRELLRPQRAATSGKLQPCSGARPRSHRRCPGKFPSAPHSPERGGTERGGGLRGAAVPGALV